TGPVQAKLWASTSGRDTDWIVRLIDVESDGTAWNLVDGIIRARFRKSVHEPPELLEPGEVYEYQIELLPTSNVFKAGHRIAVHITSSSFPMYDRNPNTGNPQGMDAELQVAQQTVFHDAARPSHILLPVVER
ncbi:MAG TPA: CocE/NonD family hydrolase, partial [Planctomycetes bacterium]|nr:CocE/NonD family hydrolase [Planctomycetota bacterium]